MSLTIRHSLQIQISDGSNQEVVLDKVKKFPTYTSVHHCSFKVVWISIVVFIMGLPGHVEVVVRSARICKFVCAHSVVLDW